MASLSEALRTAPTECQSVEDQSRATLRLLLGRGAFVRARATDPSRCPNCDRICGSHRTPYCSERCREEAAFVRQFRTSLQSGAIGDPERQVALGQKLWHLLGGGRPLRLHIAPERAIRQSITREGGKCQVCGCEATTVDHHGKSG